MAENNWVTRKECELTSTSLRNEMKDGFARLEQRIADLEQRICDRIDSLTGCIKSIDKKNDELRRDFLVRSTKIDKVLFGNGSNGLIVKISTMDAKYSGLNRLVILVVAALISLSFWVIRSTLNNHKKVSVIKSKCYSRNIKKIFNEKVNGQSELN